MIPHPSSIAEQLERYATTYATTVQEKDGLIHSLLSVITQQNEVLEFYGEESFYESKNPPITAVGCDCGRRAQEALCEAAPIIAVMEKMK